jgi:hypothetical protein
VIDVEKIWSRPRQFNDLTGLTLKQGNILLATFGQELDRLADEKRTDQMGHKTTGGCKMKYGHSGLLFMILFYMRHYPKYSILELVFDMDKKNISQWIKHLKVVLTVVLDKWGVLPAEGIKSEEEFLRLFKLGEKVYIDGTERPIQRPGNSSYQGVCYSGKKKRHIAKVVVISNERREVKVITPVDPGSKHDKNIYDENKLGQYFPEKTPVLVDTGFIGIEKTNPQIILKIPIKKPKNRGLNGGQQLKNRLISSDRVKVEHAIGGGKRNATLSDIYRGAKKSLNEITKIGFGLWNFRVADNYGTLAMSGH